MIKVAQQVFKYEIVRSAIKERKSDILIDLAIVFFGGLFAFILFMLKGIEGSISILMLIITSASIYKFMGRHTKDIKKWDTEEDLERYKKYKLHKDSRIIKKAVNGSEVYRDLLERRLVEEIVYRLENLHDIPKRKIYKMLKDDKEKLKDLVGDKYLTEFILETKYREDISGENFLKENIGRKNKLKSSEYRNKLYEIMMRIERLSK